MSIEMKQVVDYQTIRETMQENGYQDVWNEYWDNLGFPGNDCGIIEFPLEYYEEGSRQEEAWKKVSEILGLEYEFILWISW